MPPVSTYRAVPATVILLAGLMLIPCTGAEPLRDRANDLFNPIPADGAHAGRSLNEDQVELGTSPPHELESVHLPMVS